MLSLGIYWCKEAYQNWMDQPVLTTITNAGLPVEQVSNVYYRSRLNLGKITDTQLRYFIKIKIKSIFCKITEHN